jgi:glycosyltransferase involved in cell wall biosynthesis
MNIGIFSTTYLPVVGGIQFELYWLLKAIDNKFQGKGIEKFVFIVPKYENQNFLNFKNIEIIEFDEPLNTKKDFIRFVPKLSHLTKQKSIDLLNCWRTIPDGICCLATKYLNGTPYIITSQGIDIAVDYRFNYGYRLKPLTALLTKVILRKALCVTTISRDMARFAEEAGATKENIRFIPNGIELTESLSSSESISIEQKIRESHSITDSHTVYLTLSGMRKIKGHENLVRGFAQAVKTNPSLLLFIGAHGLETDNIKSLVQELKIEEYVHFIGFVDGPEKTAWFNIANVYCNTAFFEPFGLVYIEAVKHRVAVLGTVCGGARDIFEHEKSAYLVNPERIDEIINGILALSNSEYRSRLNSSASLLLPRYDINHIADLYLDSYLEFLKK